MQERENCEDSECSNQQHQGVHVTIGIHGKNKEAYFLAKITEPSAIMLYPHGEILAIGSSKGEPRKRANMRGKLHGFADRSENIADTTVCAEVVVNTEFDNFVLCGLDLKIYRHGTTNKVYFGHSEDLKWASELYERTVPDEEFLLPNLRKHEPYKKEDIFDLYESLRPMLRRIRNHDHGARDLQQREQLEKIITYTIGKECLGLPFQINHETHKQYKEERLNELVELRKERAYARKLRKDLKEQRRQSKETRKNVIYAALVSAAVAMATAGASVYGLEQRKKPVQREPPVSPSKKYTASTRHQAPLGLEQRKVEALILAYKRNQTQEPDSFSGLENPFNLQPYLSQEQINDQNQSLHDPIVIDHKSRRSELSDTINYFPPKTKK